MPDYPEGLVERVAEALARKSGADLSVAFARGNVARAVLDAITATNALVELPEPKPGWWDCHEDDGDDPDHNVFGETSDFIVTTWHDHPGQVQIAHQGEPLEPIQPADATCFAASLLAAAKHAGEQR